MPAPTPSDRSLSAVLSDPMPKPNQQQLCTLPHRRRHTSPSLSPIATKPAEPSRASGAAPPS
jgi:hypothetical protein